MAISKLNAEQFSAIGTEFSGIMFVYASKENTETGLQFFGKDYTPADKTQDAVFEAVKNVIATFWAVKDKETALRESADGIRSKLRASTPSAIIIRTVDNGLVKKFDLSESVWARLGLVPTKKDLERSARDKKKAIHNAAKAIFEAMNFRVELQKEEKEESKKPAAKTEKATPENAGNKENDLKKAA